MYALSDTFEYTPVADAGDVPAFGVASDVVAVRDEDHRGPVARADQTHQGREQRLLQRRRPRRQPREEEARYRSRSDVRVPLPGPTPGKVARLPPRDRREPIAAPRPRQPRQEWPRREGHSGDTD